MFCLPTWVAVLYGILMLLSLFIMFLLFTIVDSQKHKIERLQFFIRILKGED